MSKKPKKITLAAGANSVEFERRELTGVILEYGAKGNPSSGQTIFAHGSLKHPKDLNRVKLLSDHNRNQAAIGYMTSIVTNGSRIEATFRIPESEAGDRALIEARDGLRDGLSVGVSVLDYKYNEDGTALVALEAELQEVSLVTIPAYENARVTSLATATEQDKAQKEQPKMEPTNLDTKTPEIAGSALPIRPAPTAKPVEKIVNAGLQEVAAKFVNMHRDGKASADIAAALNKIVPADDPGKAFIRPQYVDELYKARRVDRRFFDNARSKKVLTSLKVEGYQYKLDGRPEVPEYAGNATAITSKGKLVTEHVTKDAVRRAGGWQVDRAILDLGNTEFINAVFSAAMDEYLMESEATLVKELLQEATSMQGGTTFAETLAKLGVEAAKLGSNLDIIDMSPDVWLKFAALKTDEVPWWLRSQGQLNLGTVDGKAGNISFAANPDLPEGTILAADSRAYTVYELPDLVRVNAVNIGNGAIDLGLYGYFCAIVNDKRAVIKVETGK